jgi:hypothetical protein
VTCGQCSIQPPTKYEAYPPIVVLRLHYAAFSFATRAGKDIGQLA